MAFLKRAHNRGIANIEMESLCFAAMCHRAGIKSKSDSVELNRGGLCPSQDFFSEM